MESYVIGIGVGIGLAIAATLTSKRGQALATRIEPILRERGPLVLQEVADALDMGGFYARGKVVLALNEMVTAGQVAVIDAPEGTPQLEKVKHIRYRLIEDATTRAA